MGDTTTIYNAVADTVAKLGILEGFYVSLKQVVDDGANWFEFIGFIGLIVNSTILYFLDKRVKKINRKHLLHTRIKDHIKQQKTITDNISTLLGDFENKKTEIRSEIKRSEVIAKSIKRKLEKQDYSYCKKLIKQAEYIESLRDDISQLSSWQKWWYGVEQFTEDAIANFYFTLTAFITSLEELKKDNDKTLLP